MARPVAYSAALCRGLIEAGGSSRRAAPTASSILRLYAAASLKHERRLVDDDPIAGILRLYAAASLKRRLGQAVGGRRPHVFCGFMPRPH